MPEDIWLTFPDGSEHELRQSVTIGRDPANDLTFTSNTVSREHAGITLRDAYGAVTGAVTGGSASVWGFSQLFFVRQIRYVKAPIGIWIP